MSLKTVSSLPPLFFLWLGSRLVGARVLPPFFGFFFGVWAFGYWGLVSLCLGQPFALSSLDFGGKGGFVPPSSRSVWALPCLVPRAHTHILGVGMCSLGGPEAVSWPWGRGFLFPLPRTPLYCTQVGVQGL